MSRAANLLWLAALVLPAATASPQVEFTLDVGGTIAISGNASGTIGLRAIEGTHPSSHVELSVSDGRLIVVRESRWHLKGNLTPVGPGMNLDDFANGQPQSERDERFSGQVQTTTWVTPGMIGIMPEHADGKMSLPVNQDVDLRAQKSGPRQNAFKPTFEGHPLYTNPTLPHTAWTFGSMATAGNFRTILHGVQLSISSANGTRYMVETGSFERTAVPMGNAEAVQIENVYGILEGPTTVTFAGPWEIWPSNVTLSGPIRATMTDVDLKEGNLPAPSKHFSLLELDGALSLHGFYDDGGSWRFAGDEMRVTVDGVPLDLAGNDYLIEAVATTGGLLVAIGLAKYGSNLAAAVVAGYTRAKPLANARRRQLLILVRESPGISAAELSAKLGIRRPSITFHAKVLAQHHMLRPQRISKSWHYFLPEQGQSESSSRLLAVVRHPIRRTLVLTLQESQGSLLLGDLLDALPGCPPTLALYHLGVLRRHGIIHRDEEHGYSLAAHLERGRTPVNREIPVGAST